MKPSKSAAVKNAAIIKKFIDDSQFVYEVLSNTITKLDFLSKPAYAVIRFSSAGGVSCCMDDFFVTRDEVRPVYVFWYNIYKPMLTFISLKEVMTFLGCASKHGFDMAIERHLKEHPEDPWSRLIKKPTK